MRLQLRTLLLYHNLILFLLLVFSFQVILSDLDHHNGSVFDAIMRGSHQKLLGPLFQKRIKRDVETDANTFDKINIKKETSAATSVKVSVVDTRRKNVKVQPISNANVSGVVENPCCSAAGCIPHCQFPSIPMPAMPIYPPQPPSIAYYGHTYYEPVVHNHPSLKTIKKLIRKDEMKLHRSRHRYRSDSNDYTDSSDSTDSSEFSSSSESDFDYYGAAMHIRAR